MRGNYLSKSLVQQYKHWELVLHVDRIDTHTLATLVLARAHRETALSGFSTLKKDMELRFKAAKSEAFHLQNFNLTSELNKKIQMQKMSDCISIRKDITTKNRELILKENKPELLDYNSTICKVSPSSVTLIDFLQF